MYLLPRNGAWKLIAKSRVFVFEYGTASSLSGACFYRSKIYLSTVVIGAV
jgi:hypothetical protein